MSDRLATGYEALEADSAQAVDEACDHFESAWRRGLQPTIEDALASAPAGDRAVLLRELLLVELRLRIDAGQSPDASEYRKRFSEIDDGWLTAALARSTVNFNGQPARIGVGGGAVIPGFEILGELGRGGMGVVYQARDVHLNRLVALKTLIGGPQAAPAEREQFRHEAEAIAHLDHPNIVPVYEVGDSGGALYFSMKFFAGGSLARRGQARPLDFGAIAQLVETTSRAVHHAHERGILHRDLKPSNVLLDDRGVPHVADFGLAKRFDPRVGPGDASTIAGTPGYMAPEQATGGGDLTTATDVYGLGAILYELLAGKPPFDGDSPQALVQLLTDQAPARPTARNPGVPRDLETIALKCLEKDPRRRYGTARELADDLQRWRTGRPIVARPTPAWEWVWRWIRRRPIAAALATLSIVALASLMAALAVSYQRISQSLQHEREARSSLQHSYAREQQYLYFEWIGSAQRLWSSNQTERAQQLLEACPAHLRNWEWHFLDRLRRTDCVPLPGRDVPVDAVAHSPDGAIFATADRDGLIRIWRTKSLEMVRSWKAPEAIFRLAFSPDSRHLAAADEKTVRIWNPDEGQLVRQFGGSRWVGFNPAGTRLILGNNSRFEVLDWPSGQPLHTLSGHTRAVWGGSFSPDGRHFASAAADSTVRLWDLETGQAVGEPLRFEHAAYSLNYLPDGLLLVSQTNESIVFDPATRREFGRIPPGVLGMDRMAVGPNGQWIAWPARDGTIRVWNVERREEAFAFRGHPPFVSAMSFSPDLRQLVSVGSDSTIRVWGFSRSTDGAVFCRTRAAGGLAFSPDGRRLAVGATASGTHASEAGRMSIHEVPTGRELLRLDAIGEPVFSPDDRWLITSRASGSVTIWDAADGREIRTLSAPGHRGMRLAIHPNGSRLACGTETGRVLLWNLASDQPPTVFDGHNQLVTAVAFSPDGSVLGSCDRRGKVIFRNLDGSEINSWTVNRALQRLVFAPDGRHVALAGGGPLVSIWDFRTGAETQKFHGHTSWVWGAAWTRDGTRLITGGADETVRIWDVESGQELLSLPGVRGTVGQVVISPDGRRIAASDNAVRLWEVDSTP